MNFGNAAYVAQRAENLANGEVRVYYVRSGDWDNVAYHRGQGGLAVV